MSGRSLDDIVFFGPITLKELKRSIEVDEEIIRMRIAKKKAEAIKKNQVENVIEENDENEGDDANRTYELNEKSPDSNSNQRVLNDITHLHRNNDETQLLDLSYRFSRTSINPSKFESTSKTVKNLLDETVNFNESKIGARLPTPLPDKVSKSRYATRESTSKTVKNLLDETVNFSESKIGARLPTPLPDKVSKSRFSTRIRKRLDSASKENNEENTIGTGPRVKLSDTFITDMIGEDVLNETIPDDTDGNSTDAERVGTPDIFKQKRNDAWKDSPKPKQLFQTKQSRQEVLPKNSTLLFARSPAAALITQRSIKKKTPVKSENFLFPKSPRVTKMPSSKKSTAAVAKDSRGLFKKSPVAAYIHRGEEISSMSKARHSACVEEHENIRSESGHRGRSASGYKGHSASGHKGHSASGQKGSGQCKIPVAVGENVKRKLDLGETKSRRPLFTSPKDHSG